MRGRDLRTQGTPATDRVAPAPPPRRSAGPLAVPEGLGNRQRARWARTLSRRDKVVTVGLGSPPPPPPPVDAVKRATPANMELAKLIDELEKLSSTDLLARRDTAVAGAVAPVGDQQRRDLQTLRAIEFLVQKRHLVDLKPDYRGTSATSRRLAVRAQLEEGVRETGSFSKALKRYTRTSEVESDYQFFEKEAEVFGKQFEQQAGDTARAMLDFSKKELVKVLDSYGMPATSAGFAVERILGGSDVEKEAERVVSAAKAQAREEKIAEVSSKKPKTVDRPEHEMHRESLAQTAKELKRLQKIVSDRFKAKNLADLDRPMGGPQAGKAKWEAADKAQAQYDAALDELRTAWIQAERLHPILAAYRRGGKVEDVDLGTLDTDVVEDEMKSVLMQVLPKIADIERARNLVRIGKLSPLSLPPVVALTQANMFIPAGSLRAGVVKDLVDEKADDDPIWLKVAAIALAIVTLLPSGGTSIGIAAAGMAGAGIAAHSAAKAWLKYDTQKTLANTDLDLAQSLSSEEPSLTGFAVSLVSLGLEAIPLVGAFNKARRIKALVAEGRETKTLVHELNLLGGKRAPDLGERALAEAKAAEAQAAKMAKPHDVPDRVPVKQPRDIDPHDPKARPTDKPTARTQTDEPDVAKGAPKRKQSTDEPADVAKGAPKKGTTTTPAPDAPAGTGTPVAAVDDRIVTAKRLHADAVRDAAGKAERARASADKVAGLEREVAELDQSVKKLRSDLKTAEAERDRAKDAWDKAKTGRKAKGDEYRAKRDAAKKIESDLEKANDRIARLQPDVAHAQKMAEWRQGLADEAAARVELAEVRLARAEKLAQGKAPRLKPGDAFDPEKRRPLLPKNGPKLPTGRGGPDEIAAGVPVRIFKDPLKSPQHAKRLRSILKQAEKNPQQAGNEFSRLIGEEQGWRKVAEKFGKRRGLVGRRWDFGNTMEVTIEGRLAELGDHKLDQLWFDLNEYGTAIITVPQLSAGAEAQLARMAYEWKQWTNREPLILVREVAP